MRTLLIDGDILVYTFGLAVERVDEDGRCTSFSLAKRILKNWLNKVIRTLEADEYMVALSGPTTECFRMNLLPTYKGGRNLSDRPLCFDDLRQHILDKYQAKIVNHLEADDVLGIWSTHPDMIPGEKIIVSRDKDFFSVPGLFYKTDQKDKGVQEISFDSAQRYHLYQTLLGDKTDNYKGCPGCGPSHAKALLANPYIIEPYTHIMKRGPRRGQEITRYRNVPTEDLWAAVVSQFKFYGFTEEDALREARCARILRHGEYNYDTKEPILWTPSMIVL